MDTVVPSGASRVVSVSGRAITIREAGTGPALVLLHGIGSGAASWQAQFATLSDRYRVIAWDAPGYGGSDMLPGAPMAVDYAAALDRLLTALGVAAADLVGHSLGALIAASCARHYPRRVRTLTIADPAAGYGSADAATREARLSDRLKALAELGPQGLAEKRSGALLSANASPEARARVRDVMAQVRPDGYRAAAAMLGGGDIFADAAFLSCPVLVLCGSEDTITPEAGCRKIAAAIKGAVYRALPGLGHASYVEGPEAFNAILLEFLNRAR